MILGIDTSCYTTSLALVSTNGELISQQRKILPVKKGNRGLSQSEALFYHIKQLPSLYGQLLADAEQQGKRLAEVKLVCVSDRPRPLEESYMPVFLGGLSFAQVIAATLGTPLHFTTHQEGHILAGVWSGGLPVDEPFLAVHLSGGTTEILLARWENAGLSLKKVGGSADIAAGQMADRVGVAMGMQFPAGRELDLFALTDEAVKGEQQNFSYQEGFFSLSGPESDLQRKLSQGVAPLIVAKTLWQTISRALAKSLSELGNIYQCEKILLVGGVAGSKNLRCLLPNLLPEKQLFFCNPEFSGDNSVGVALAGKYFVIDKMSNS